MSEETNFKCFYNYYEHVLPIGVLRQVSGMLSSVWQKKFEKLHHQNAEWRLKVDKKVKKFLFSDTSDSMMLMQSADEFKSDAIDGTHCRKQLTTRYFSPFDLFALCCGFSGGLLTLRSGLRYEAAIASVTSQVVTRRS